MPVRRPQVRARGAAPALPLLALLAAATLHAQAAPPAPCPLSGRVVDGDGRPVAAAVLEARPAAEPAAAPARALTDAEGRYCLRTRGAGEHLLLVDKPGFIARTVLLGSTDDAAPRVVDVRLTRDEPVRLAPVLAQARRTPQPTRRGAPAGSELFSRSGGQAALYPGAPGDLAASAGVSGQYLPVGEQELSIEGQPSSGNRTTLDGAGFDAADVPAEGLAAAGVFAHPYDVSRGQFTGGEIAGRTMGGTNVWGGGARLSLEPPWLTYGGLPSDEWGAQGHRAFLSAGGGGPLLPGRLFVYAAAQGDDRGSSAPGLGGDDPLPAAYGVAPDSLARFLSILQRLGIESGPGQANRRARSASGLLRLDYLPTTHHTLMLRLDGRRRESSGGAASALGTGSAAGERAGGSGALLQLTSRAGPAENELSLRRSVSSQRVRRVYDGPAGQVWVGSEAGEGVSGASLGFGGEALALSPEDGRVVEVGDRLVLSPRGGAHQLQLGVTAQWERAARTLDADRLGTFSFASLADLEAGRPTRFTRTLGDGRAALTAAYAAVYAGDQWKLGRELRAIAGVRAERWEFASLVPVEAPALETFGLRPVPAGGGWSVSPRAGVTWYHHGPVTEWGVLGGAGLFRGAASPRALAAALAQGGGVARLVCVGDEIPTPRWADYARDPDTLPTRCANDPGEPAAAAPEATGFSPGYAPPRVWHGSLSASWLHRPSATGAELRLGISRGSGLALAVDRNLAVEPRFVLASEGGRPVFVAPDAIEAATGQLALRDSRADGRFGTVREVGGGGRSAVEFLSLGVNRLTGHGLVELYYTFTRSRDQATGMNAPLGAMGTTAADPRRAEWAASDFEQRHALQLSLIRQVGRWGTLTVTGRVVSDLPFTPLVDADINGDGVANDRAFVFAPKSGSATVGDEMEALLARLGGPERACLLQQVGRVAARNSCHGGWTPFLDAQLNVFPGGRRNRRLAVNVAAQNLASGVDYLLHGRDGLRGWGQLGSADPVLLRVSGFDPGRREFRYQVNPGFGSATGRSATARFSLRIQARVTLGADPATQALVAQAVQHQSQLDPDSLRVRMLRRWPNLAAAVLAYDARAGLALTPAQSAALAAAADSFRVRAAPLAAQLAEAVAGLGGTSGEEVHAALVRQAELQDGAQALLDAAVEAVRSTLTPGQWARLPTRLRAPPRASLPVSPQGGVELLPDF